MVRSNDGIEVFGSATGGLLILFVTLIDRRRVASSNSRLKCESSGTECLS